MSIQSTSPSTDRRAESAQTDDDDYDHDPGEVYDKVILDNHSICSRCFRLQWLVSSIAVPLQVSDSHGDKMTWSVAEDADIGDSMVAMEVGEPTDNIEFVYPPRVEDPRQELDIPQSWKRSCPPPQTVCECGAVDDDGTRAPLSKSEAVEHARRIADRLEELGIGASRQHLVGAVERWKPKGWLGGHDYDIFVHAVRVAVEKYRTGTFTAPKKDSKNGGLVNPAEL